MTANHQDILLDSQLSSCPTCASQMTSAGQPNSYYASNLCRHVPPILHQRYLSHPSDLEQPSHQYRQDFTSRRQSDFDLNPLFLRVACLDPTPSEPSETSVDTYSTMRGIVPHVRDDLLHAVSQNYQDPTTVVGTQRQQELTERAMQALQISHAHTYSGNIHGWVLGHPIAAMTAQAQHTVDLDVELGDSMILSRHSATSDRSVITGSSWCLVDEAGNFSNADDSVRATGRQFDDDSASPWPFEDMLDSLSSSAMYDSAQ